MRYGPCDVRARTSPIANKVLADTYTVELGRSRTSPEGLESAAHAGSPHGNTFGAARFDQGRRTAPDKKCGTYDQAYFLSLTENFLDIQ